MKQQTSWEPVSEWYNNKVGKAGHYYHQQVVVPRALRLLALRDGSSVLDLAAGQGVLARHLPENIYYQGIDVAPSLIAEAKKSNQIPLHHFTVADITRPTLPIQKKDFTHAAIILALQNIAQPEKALQTAAQYLRPSGQLVIVLNHPCFRIPRQSSWEIDPKNKTQFRRIDRYLSPLKIPITAHPGQRRSTVTWSFHQPLAAYTQMLHDAGFVIEVMEEWVSDKKSEGTVAKMENRSRSEFPLFLAILAKKQ